jgi:site-specific DNA-methyltransferase (adenine-specific)
MAYMATLGDNAFDLAIVDPPYGINAPNMNMGSWGKYKSTASRLKRNRFDKGGGHYANSAFVTMNTDWDLNPPSRAYFEELFRVSKNQIIFGGNYFGLPPTRCFVCWDKLQALENFSQVEYAWTSFDYPSKIVRIGSTGGRNDVERIHPTQKPVKLYLWLMQKFCKPGDSILDTHLGSGSSRIAAASLGYDFMGIEIDKQYFDAQEKRFGEYLKEAAFVKLQFAAMEYNQTTLNLEGFEQ